MRVVTWNLWWRFGPWEQRQPAIATTLAGLEPDIVGLQEVWSADEGPDQVAMIAEELGFSHARTPQRFHRGLSFGNAIVSRWPIRRSEVRHLPPHRAGGGHRTVLFAEVDAPHGPVPVFTTHLAYRFDESALRQEQIAHVMEFVAEMRGNPEVDHPPIVLGDFNAVPTSDEIRRITGESAPPVPGLVLTDAWPQAGDGPGSTWTSANPYCADASWPERRIDYVFIGWPRPKPLGNVAAAALAGVEPVEGVQPSDHYAVVVDLIDER